MGENLKIVWAEFLTLHLTVLVLRAIEQHILNTNVGKQLS
jgi:hypothetical protein